MKQSISFYSFRQAFYDCDRQDHFPNGGLSVLWDYLESYEEDTGEEIELDVIAFCCDYNQMTFEEVIKAYCLDASECVDLSEQRDLVMDYLNDNTSVVGEVGDDEVIFAGF